MLVYKHICLDLYDEVTTIRRVRKFMVNRIETCYTYLYMC